MPSIPQSLLWISLVVLWLFVLVPMLISKRDAVRRTSDVALATRVLNSGATARLLKRGGPAAGHRSDPDWRPEHDVDEDTRSVVVQAAATEDVESEYLDVDIVEEGSGLPPGAEMADPPPPDVDDQAEDDQFDDDAEYETEDVEDDEPGWTDDDEPEDLEDSPGVHAEAESPMVVASGASRRRRYDPKTAEAVSARKYNFRKRTLMVMAAILVLSATAAFTMTPAMWWLCGTTAGVTVLYLAYLRRQTRIEERVRQRRMQRMARARLGVENTRDDEYDVVPSRLRQPGAAVLDIDDEDPAFEHLDDASYARDYDWRRDLPRAAGQ